MGKRGPAPTPNALKIANGTYRHDRHGDAAVLPPGIPEKPEWLGEIGSAVWDATIAKLRSVDGLLSPVDGAALAIYCDAWEDFHDALETINQEGAVCIGEKGGRYAHPAVNQKNSAKATIAKYEAKFGLTPSDRVGLKIQPTKILGVRRRERA